MAYGQTPGPHGSYEPLRFPAGTINAWSHAELPGPLSGRWAMDRLAGGLLAWRPMWQWRPRPTPEGQKRHLTSGEVTMAWPIFKDSLNYGEVYVHNEEFLPFGLQPDDTAMTPNGEMYFNPKRFREDFSRSTDSDAHWFMHEMVHVWQYQLGYPVMLRGAIRIGVEYEYELEEGKTLGDYNMEAQGDLLADYFALKVLRNPRVMAQSRYANALPLYERVLALFIADPSNEDNLP